MKKKVSLNRLKLIQAGNAVHMTHQRFNEDLKDLALSKKLKMQEKPSSCQKEWTKRLVRKIKREI